MSKGLNLFICISLTQFPLIISQNNFIVNNGTVGVCICVSTGSCGLAGGSSSNNGGSTADGSGAIDVRIVNVSVSINVPMTNEITEQNNLHTSNQQV